LFGPSGGSRRDADFRLSAPPTCSSCHNCRSNAWTSRYQTGIDPYLNVITAHTTLLSDQQAEVTLRVNEMTAAVQLIQALGGGWDTGQLEHP
jgi:hypothetical protein